MTVQPARRPLEFQDLKRFEETIKPPFRRALEVGRVDLLPPPEPDRDSDDPLARAAGRGKAVFDERAGRLVVPLLEQGRCLGLVVAWGVKAEQLHPVVSGFLSALMETALDLARLRLAAETDPVTGLANEQSLDEALTGALSRLGPSPLRGRPALKDEQAEEGLVLLALEPQGMDDLRARYGRRLGDQVLAELARLLREAAPEALCLARLGDAFLVLARGGAAAARDLASRLGAVAESLALDTPDGRDWRLRLTLGAATVGAAAWREQEGSGLALEAAAVLKSRALRALACAGRLGPGQVLFFGEIVEKAGTIKEIMPLNRVRLDLGRVHGLGEGERFQVVVSGDEGQQVPKAELSVVTVGEQDSVAELTALLDPTWSLRPGDRLRRLGREGAETNGKEREKSLEVAGRKVRVILDQVTGLPSHRSFMSLFSALCAGAEGFAAALMRVEGLEGMREVCGSVGAEALVKALAACAVRRLPKGALLGRFAPDTLGVLLPGGDAEKLRQAAAEVLEEVGRDLDRPLRAGIAAHPCPGFTPAHVLDNAAKALVHAGFLDPGAAVIFDAVSLNVSGDALFAQGRILEAVVEYEKALGLNPQEVNVLNSLGVCYGHLGQMDKALEYFRRAQKAAPEDYMAYYNLGYALMGRGKLAEAKQQLERALELNPDHADTLFQLGRLAQGEGQLNQALEYFRRAASQEKYPRAVQRHLGEALSAAGRFAEAEQAFKEAVKLKPNDAAALSGLAGLYLDRGANREIALSLARRAGELEPAVARHQRVAARALFELGRLAEAQKLLEQAISRHPDDPFLAVQLAEVLAAEGNTAAARDQYTRALSLEPHLEAARQGLARLEQEAEPDPPADQHGNKPEDKGKRRGKEERNRPGEQ